MSIVMLLNQVKTGEIVLPAIQRDFVWSHDRIQMLLDSVMRGYPVGIVLLWETYEDIQSRPFVKDYNSDSRYIFADNPKHGRLKLVLDGQQRLQSLYVALYGTYEGESLFFDVLSGYEMDDSGLEQYLFKFGEDDNMAQLNADILVEPHEPPPDNEQEDSRGEWPSYWVKVKELFAMGVRERHQFIRTLVEQLSLSDSDSLRMGTNLARFDEAMTKDENILKCSIIDENRPSDSQDRQSESDVLEIFVRINRQGISLNRSDLIFSMLKLNWKESAEALPEFIRRISIGNSLELDSDFVIRCLFAVSDLGTRFDLDLLRAKSKVEALKTNFQNCCRAIASAVDFVQRECWCSSSTVIGGSSTLIPLVYYLFHAPKHQVPDSQTVAARKGVFLLGFSTPFSRYADSRLGRFIKDELRPLGEAGDVTFPFDRATAWVKYWEQIDGFGERLLGGNHQLTLHLVQRQTGAKVHYDPNSPQIDHIFPRSVLRKKHFAEAEINHFANFWILGKGKNQNKSNRNPKDYFADVSDTELKRALINRELLDYRRYRTFISERSQAIQRHISATTGLSEADFETESGDKEAS